jgi:hypothetical protein
MINRNADHALVGLFKRIMMTLPYSAANSIATTNHSVFLKDIPLERWNFQRWLYHDVG